MVEPELEHGRAPDEIICLRRERHQQLGLVVGLARRVIIGASRNEPQYQRQTFCLPAIRILLSSRTAQSHCDGTGREHNEHLRAVIWIFVPGVGRDGCPGGLRG